MISSHVTVHIDLDRVRSEAEGIRRRTKVDLIAVIKADAYGLGAGFVADALAGVVQGFYVFELAEARDIELKRYARPILSLLDDMDDPVPYEELGVRPVVWTADRASALRRARPVLSVDTGQQRFACEAEAVDRIVKAGSIDEAMTHAKDLAQVKRFLEATSAYSLRRHAAGSGLLDEPAAWLDAVRPGLALYEEAVTVTTPLVDARDSKGPAGYGGFVTQRHGVILAGYAHGLRQGVCVINNQRRRIVEVGMQTAFVELGAKDRVGNRVTLLGETLRPNEVATHWHTTPQEVLVRMCAMGPRSYQAK